MLQQAWYTGLAGWPLIIDCGVKMSLQHRWDGGGVIAGCLLWQINVHPVMMGCWSVGPKIGPIVICQLQCSDERLGGIMSYRENTTVGMLDNFTGRAQQQWHVNNDDTTLGWREEWSDLMWQKDKMLQHDGSRETAGRYGELGYCEGGTCGVLGVRVW